MPPSASPSNGDASGRTPTTASWFRVYWLTYQARYVRVCLSRRAMHASCESPWHFSAKRHVLGACFSLMAPFRTRFSRDEMAHSAHVQRLRRCLYTFWYPYIPTCRFHGTACPGTRCHRPSDGTTRSDRFCGSASSGGRACCTSLQAALCPVWVAGQEPAP